jgi:hypothetical protein
VCVRYGVSYRMKGAPAMYLRSRSRHRERIILLALCLPHFALSLYNVASLGALLRSRGIADTIVGEATQPCSSEQVRRAGLAAGLRPCEW